MDGLNDNITDVVWWKYQQQVAKRLFLQGNLSHQIYTLTKNSSLSKDLEKYNSQEKNSIIISMGQLTKESRLNGKFGRYWTLVKEILGLIFITSHPTIEAL